jgi:hypothetical protein
MATVVIEDGTGKPDANVYVDTTTVDAGSPFFPNTKWLLLTTGQKETNLVAVTEYLDELIVWLGVRLLPTQGLEWPRFGVYEMAAPDADHPDGKYPVEGVPAEIKQSDIDLALAYTEGLWLPPAAQAVAGAPVSSLSLGGGAVALDFDTDVSAQSPIQGLQLPPIIVSRLVPMYGFAENPGAGKTFWTAGVYRTG